MLVPADAQLSIAHNDARVHHPTSAMAPGTLMLGDNFIARGISHQ